MGPQARLGALEICAITRRFTGKLGERLLLAFMSTERILSCLGFMEHFPALTFHTNYAAIATYPEQRGFGAEMR